MRVSTRACDCVSACHSACIGCQARGHLFKILGDLLALHTDLRERLSTAKSFDEMESIAQELARREGPRDHEDPPDFEHSQRSAEWAEARRRTLTPSASASARPAGFSFEELSG